MTLCVGFLSHDAAVTTAEAWSGRTFHPRGSELFALRTERSWLELEDLDADEEIPGAEDVTAVIELMADAEVDAATDETAAQDARALFRFAAAHGVTAVLLDCYTTILERTDGPQPGPGARALMSS